jgi:hypothetical protein
MRTNRARRLGRSALLCALREPAGAVGFDAGLVDLRDAGMLQPGQRLDLGLEAVAAARVAELGAQDLERDAAARSGLFGGVYDAHAALAEQLPEHERAELAAGALRDRGRARRARRWLQELVVLVVSQQAIDGGAQFAVAADFAIEPGGALGRRHFERSFEGGAHLRPGAAHRSASSARRNALASRQLRSVLLSDTPMVSATSCIGRPAKKRSSTSSASVGSTAVSRCIASSSASRSIARAS